eukprot:scaffold182453_cov19-Tisochrysis_lutea.AAC.1
MESACCCALFCDGVPASQTCWCTCTLLKATKKSGTGTNGLCREHWTAEKRSAKAFLPSAFPFLKRNCSLMPLTKDCHAADGLGALQLHKTA